MGTSKRERQKANRQQRRMQDAKAERRSRAVRTIVQWGLGILAAVLAVLAIFWLTGGFDDDGDVTPNSTDTVTTTVESPAPSTNG